MTTFATSAQQPRICDEGDASLRWATATTAVVGVMGVRRKLDSKAMCRILSYIGEYDVGLRLVQIDEHVMSRQSIEQWPIVDVVIPLYSKLFPLQKVLKYVALRSPIVVNDLQMQTFMQDRRTIRNILAKHNVPTPPAVYVNRSVNDRVVHTGHNGNTLTVFSSARSAQFRIHKPFVEKPVDPEDHSKLSTTTFALTHPRFWLLLFSSHDFNLFPVLSCSFPS